MAVVMNWIPRWVAYTGIALPGATAVAPMDRVRMFVNVTRAIPVADRDADHAAACSDVAVDQLS